MVLDDEKRALLGDHEAAPYPERCNGCRWRGRHQKCSCCRRNANLKDCYETAQNTRAPILSAEEMEMLEGMK